MAVNRGALGTGFAFLSYCEVLHGTVWYCVVLRGIAWYCVVSHNCTQGTATGFEFLPISTPGGQITLCCAEKTFAQILSLMCLSVCGVSSDAKGEGHSFVIG